MRPSLSYETTPLEDGIRRTVEWYLENQGWWRPLLEDKFFASEVSWKAAAGNADKQ
jgi:dTDP-glucose 4,6-dehydratase